MEINFQVAVAVATIWFLTALGCIVAFIYCEHKGIRSSEDFWRKMLPERSTAFYFRADFLLSCVVGTVIGIVAFNPNTSVEAISAGLGWTAAFGVLKAKTQPAEKDGKASD
ncbi:MAG: hypothetical protein J7494_00230 [Sphingobium sp.]|nr:hypothetical protein [Sphingobium sp.]